MDELLAAFDPAGSRAALGARMRGSSATAAGADRRRRRSLAMASSGPTTSRDWAGGAAIIGAGLAIWLLNFFYRHRRQPGIASATREERAREYFDAHGALARRGAALDGS